MADNTVLDPGTGGDTIATDDIAGVKHQRVKVQHGADGSATDVSAASPLPVSDAGGSLTVDVGTALPAGANAIGKLAANSGVDIGDVDVTSEPATAADGAVGLPAVAKVIAGYDGTNVQALATDASGLLQVDVATAPTTAVTGPLTDAELRATAVPISGTVTASGPLTDAQLRATAVPVSLATVPSHAVTNAGTFAVQVDGNALTALQLIDDTVFTDDAAFTVATSKVNAIGLLADQASTDSVNEGDVGIPRMTLDRKQITTVAPSNDTEGLDVFRSIDLDETEEEAKATAGKVYGWYIYNAHTAALYVKLYNATAANVTVGTTTPRMTIPIPASSAANVEFTNGITFDTAITAAATTGVADNDTGAPAANLLQINLFYK